MVHLIAMLFFAGVLVGVALILQYTIRDHWQDMIAALLGRPLPSRAVRRPVPERVSVPRAGRRRAVA